MIAPVRVLQLSLGFVVGLLGVACGNTSGDGDCVAGQAGCECLALPIQGGASLQVDATCDTPLTHAWARCCCG
jgi:hypothetical protein